MGGPDLGADDPQEACRGIRSRDRPAHRTRRTGEVSEGPGKDQGTMGQGTIGGSYGTQEGYRETGRRMVPTVGADLSHHTRIAEILFYRFEF